MKNKDLIKAVVILAVIALISGALLGLFYQITFVTEAEKEQRIVASLQNIYKSDNYEKIDFRTDNTELNKSIQYFFEDKSAKVYIIVATGKSGYKDKVPMYVIIKDDKIIALKEGNKKETPGISDAAFSEEYFNKFLKPIKELDFGEDIDTETGATYSRRAVISSVENAVNFYKQYKGNL